MPIALLHAIYSAELKEEALKTAPPGESTTDVNKLVGEDDVAKTQLSILTGVNSNEQTPAYSKGSTTDISKGRAGSVGQESREDVNSREKSAESRPSESTRPIA